MDIDTLIEAKNRKDAEKVNERLCSAAIEGVLQQYGCDLVGVPSITPDGRIVADVLVVTKEK
jgi:hypothetical protein